MPRYQLKPETFWFPVFCFPQDVSLLLYKVPIHIERNRHTTYGHAAAAFIIEHNRKPCIKTLYQKYLKKVLVAASP